ncbi:MAG: glucose-1-phosphate adenylyltransferase [Acidobacteria bacterium]|nr:glucose-1-phosphate adenylyltransferase [Acidobacteriota bacterium]
MAFVLAGGKGTRLSPLTKERAKPAVPFGGRYRIIDFVLTNLVNSGINSIYVLIQFKSQSLLQHLRDGWEFSGVLKSQFIIPVPAQMRSEGETWYRGTADAIYQNINLIEQADPHLVAIFGADHIYRMNIRQMVEFHEQRRADCTVAAIPVHKSLASEFGVIETDHDGRIIGFHEKKADAPTMPNNPDMVLASMGNYIFSTPALTRELYDDARKPANLTAHDFGQNILPGMVGRSAIYAYDFNTNHIPGDPLDQPAYWRDVGTLDAYYEANMDLRNVVPLLNLYNKQWPLRTAGYEDPPAKFIFNQEGRRGMAVESIVGGGTIISGGYVKGSVLGRGVRVYDGAVVEDSIIFDNCIIGKGARVRNAILDKNVIVADGDSIGIDLAADAKRPGFHVNPPSPIVVVEGKRSKVSISTIDL